MRRIPNAGKDVLTDFVLEHIERGAEVRTDGWVGYNDIGRYRFSHVVTNVAASGDPAHVAMPEVHRVASPLKRWLMRHPPGRRLPRPARLLPRRVTFRFNRRRSRHRGLLFYRPLEQAVTTAPQPYKTLKAEHAA